ncbi:MAG: TonB-dependent receptor [Spirochaetota bacterium]|nr:TonB-dependent receptor [Spirochaetota bacterium]
MNRKKLYSKHTMLKDLLIIMKKIALSSINIFLITAIGIADEGSGRTFITADEIKKMNVRNFYDLLNQVPGIVADVSTVSIRGSKKVKVLLDGRSINDPVSDDVKWSQVSINNVERVEIYKGGGSVEYGGDSSGGVILITTKKTKKWSGNIESYGGNLCTQCYSTDLQTNINNFIAGVSVGYHRTDGFRTNDDREKKRAGIKLSYELQKDIKFSPSFDYYNEKRGLAGVVGQPTPEYRKYYETNSGTLISKIKKIKSRTCIIDVVEKNKNPDVPIEVRLHPITFDQEITSQFAINELGKLSMGTGIQYAEVDVTKGLPDGEEEEMHIDRKSWIFATYDYQFKDFPLSLYSGVRGIYYSRFPNAINPEIQLRYGREKNGIIVGFNMTDNSPTFKQRYNQTTVTMPNPDLNKERAINNSITLFSHQIESITVNIAPFYNIVYKIIVLNSFYDGGQRFLKYENVDKAILNGVDTSIDWRPAQTFCLNLCYIYLRAKDDSTNNNLPGKSRHEVKIKSIIQPFNIVSIAITSSYISKQYSNISNSKSVAGYYLTTCRTDLKLNNLKAFAEVKNIFDEEYILYYGYPESPRTWIAGLQYEF